MKCVRLVMLATSAAELVLILFIGVWDGGDASPVGTTQELPHSTSMPNHLPDAAAAVTADPRTTLRGAWNSTTPNARHTTEWPAVQATSTSHALSTVSGHSTNSQSNDTSAPGTSRAPTLGFPCNCSLEGSTDAEDCERTTGQCSCLPGYTGARCDSCQDGYFTNGTTSCLPCDCDSFGATGNSCDSSGVCTCKTGVSGSKCDDCQSGYFQFSSAGCRPCMCSNHSGYCHPQSGICINCQGNTKGPACEECRYNFYRRPGSPLTAVCLPCPCSTVTSTGSCHIDLSGQPVCDQCRPEYNGPNCDRCTDGFYNSDSICVQCDCSGNADPATSPRLCNPDTGQCLSCIHNTSGPRCEFCETGYTGDALAHNCTKVVELPDPDLSSTTASPTTDSPSRNSRTMSSHMNSTGTSAAASTQALLPESSTAAITEVSWTQFNIIVLAVITVVLLMLMGFVGAVYTYREYQNRKLNAPFWTIELKEDNISFSSYHDTLPSADVSGLLDDESSEVAANGQLALTTAVNMYKA